MYIYIYIYTHAYVHTIHAHISVYLTMNAGSECQKAKALRPAKDNQFENQAQEDRSTGGKFRAFLVHFMHSSTQVSCTLSGVCLSGGCQCAPLSLSLSPLPNPPSPSPLCHVCMCVCACACVCSWLGLYPSVHPSIHPSVICIGLVPLSFWGVSLLDDECRYQKAEGLGPLACREPRRVRKST